LGDVYNELSWLACLNLGTPVGLKEVKSLINLKRLWPLMTLSKRLRFWRC